MAGLDAKVAAVVDHAAQHDHDDSDEDALIALLEEDDPELDALREQRLNQLHVEYQKARELRAGGHGTYEEVKDEKKLLDLTTSTERCVVHFFKPDFHRCAIMDSHLESLAPAHYEARLVRINVENCPFLVTKLKIQVLPCVIAFLNGVGVDRIIGFEGLGRTPDRFTTRELEARLIRATVLLRPKVESAPEEKRGGSGIRDKKREGDEDEEDEWA